MSKRFLLIVIGLLVVIMIITSIGLDTAWSNRYKEQAVALEIAAARATAVTETLSQTVVELEEVKTKVSLYKQTLHQREIDIEALKKQAEVSPEESFYQGVFAVCRLARVPVDNCTLVVGKYYKLGLYKIAKQKLLMDKWDFSKIKGEAVY